MACLWQQTRLVQTHFRPLCQDCEFREGVKSRAHPPTMHRTSRSEEAAHPRVSLPCVFERAEDHFLCPQARNPQTQQLSSGGLSPVSRGVTGGHTRRGRDRREQTQGRGPIEMMATTLTHTQGSNLLPRSSALAEIVFFFDFPRFVCFLLFSQSRSQRVDAAVGLGLLPTLDLIQLSVQECRRVILGHSAKRSSHHQSVKPSHN